MKAQFTVYTDEASFLGAINTDFYRETFPEALYEELLSNSLPESRDFLSNGFGYSLSSPEAPEDGGLYPTSIGPWLGANTDFVVCASYPRPGLLLTNFSPNVSAVGGNFFALGYDDKFTNTPVSITATLVNGAIFETNYFPGGVNSYLGLSFSGQGIASLRILNASNAPTEEYMTINNFTAGSIGKTNASVVLGNLSQTYDGSAKPVTAMTIPPGLNVALTYDGFPAAPTNAGSYALAATINDANYQGTASGTLVVAKAAASITLEELKQTYDGSAKTVSVTTTPSGLNVELTYNGSPEAPVHAGTYAVLATVNDVNYEGVASGELFVATAYENWADANSLIGEAADASADPDMDGWPNALEFAFGLVPTSAGGQPVTLGADGTKIVFLQRREASYVVRSSTNIAAGFAGTVTPVKTSPQPIGLPSGYEQFEALLPRGAARGFLKVEATVQP